MIPPSINASAVLTDDRQSRSLMGLGRDDFEKLSNQFTSCLNEDRRKNRTGKLKKHRQRKVGGGRKPALGPPENQLFFILFYLKNYPTYDALAFAFGIGRSGAFQSVRRLLPVLRKTQKNPRVLPKRTADDPRELLQLVASVDRVWIDATERPLRRPRKPARQKSVTAEKKAFIPSNTAVSDTSKWVLILGKTVPGSLHDHSLFKEEFDPKTDWFASTEASADLGYQGIKTDCLAPENIGIPHKKPRRSKRNPDPQLTREQRRENRRIGRVRVLVEHAIGGMKAFRVLTVRLRNHLKRLADDFIFAAAGLWNLKNSFVVQWVGQSY